MVEYKKVNVKLSDTQLIKTGTTLRISFKMSDGINLHMNYY